MNRFYSRAVSRRQLRTLITASWVDVLVAAGLFAWAVPDVPWWWKPAGHVAATPVVVGYLVLALAVSVPFLWRRRLPATVLTLCAGVLAARAALHQNVVSVFAALLVGAYGLGAYGATARRYARWLGALSLVAAIVADMAQHGRGRLSAVPFALLGAAFLVGDAATARRNELVSAVDAAHVAERTRIARELHDVVAHQLSAIAVQAGAARMGAETSPISKRDDCFASTADATQTARGPRTLSSVQVLATVEQLAREALGELGHLLGVLRHEADDGPARRPAPTLAELDALLDTSRTAGVPVDLATVGRARDLTPGLEVSAYRIVQESLINVRKYAPGASTLVTLTYHTDRLEVKVVNGRSPLLPVDDAEGTGRHPVFLGGRGLVGMRERADLYDGTFRARTQRGGGFAVIATLSYRRSTETP